MEGCSLVDRGEHCGKVKVASVCGWKYLVLAALEELWSVQPWALTICLEMVAVGSPIGSPPQNSHIV